MDVAGIIGIISRKMMKINRASTINSLRALKNLKVSLDAVKSIKEIIDSNSCQSLPYLLQVFEIYLPKLTIIQDIDFNSLGEINNILEESLDREICGNEGSIDDRHLCTLLKSGVNALLDVSRKALDETTQDILEYTETISGKYYNIHFWCLKGISTIRN